MSANPPSKLSADRKEKDLRYLKETLDAEEKRRKIISKKK